MTAGGPDDGAPAPPDPTVELAVMAVTMHVLFEAYKAAGFSDYQACVILGTFIAVSGSGGASTPPPPL